MKYFGAHVSASGGVENAPLNAAAIGANAFALFTKNQRQWVAPPLTPGTIAAFRENCEKGGFTPSQILPHDSYLINLGSPDPDGLAKSRAAFFDEMQRCEQLGLDRLNFHPGSHVKQGAERGIELIVEGLNATIEPGMRTTVLLETMAGKGTEVGRSFEELARIIDGVDHDESLGVCLDTCHVWDAGYDIVDDLDGVLDEFDRAVGLDRLRALHLNDSKNPCGSHKDRHEKIGEGHIGKAAFSAVVTNPRLFGLPMILETPNDLLGYSEEIAMLRGYAGKGAQ